MARTNGRTLRTDKQRKDYLASVIKRELTQSEGANQDELQANRKAALDYYNAKPRGDEIKGRSQVISTDVADMTNATLAMIMPMLTTDCVAEFKQNGPDDGVRAKSESDVVNSVIIDDNRGFVRMQAAFKDGLLMKNSVMKVRVDEREDVATFDVSAADDEQRAFLLQETAQNETRVIEGDTLTVTTRTRKFEALAVPAENISYQRSYSGPLQDIRFFAERVELTRSDLVEMGADKNVVAKLPTYSEADTATQRARDVSRRNRRDAETRDQDIIDCHEVYLLIDLDGDGVSERYKCLYAGRSVCLMYEPTDIVPYAIGTPFINPHRITGESLFDHLKATQDSKTAFLRQWHDNVTAINNGKFAYDPSRVAEEDVLKPLAGGGIRARNPRDSVVPIVIPDVSSGIAQALQYEDQRRTERGGASLDLMSADAQLIGETAHGIERQISNREAMATLIAMNFAETMIRDLYLLMHEFMRRGANAPVAVEVAGQWVQVDPRAWPKRDRINVVLGLSPSQRSFLMNVLSQQQQLQVQAMQSGMDGVLADATTVYQTNQEWLRLAGVSQPKTHAIDPRSPAAQQAAQRNAATAQAAQDAQQQLVERGFQLEGAKLAENARQHDGDLQHKFYDTQMDAQIAEAKIAGEGVITLEQERIKAGANNQSRTGRTAPSVAVDRTGAGGNEE